MAAPYREEEISPRSHFIHSQANPVFPNNGQDNGEHPDGRGLHCWAQWAHAQYITQQSTSYILFIHLCVCSYMAREAQGGGKNPWKVGEFKSKENCQRRHCK